jgi:hypothetical protein
MHINTVGLGRKARKKRIMERHRLDIADNN